jgi:DHA2 family multidrug resistance protein-like MFS transporter
MAGRGSSRWLAFGAIVLGVLAVGLDVTVLSVALPTLAGALNASESELQWFSSGYALVLGAAILPAGLLGDRYGRKRVMVGALILFGLGSIACAYAPSAEAFIAARLVLGLAGAALTVMALSMVTALFSEQERPRAVGIWAAANFMAFPIGPILGGWVLTNFWWGWVFLVNVPVVLVGLLVVTWLVPESRATEPPGLDVIGILTSSAGLAFVTYGLIEAGLNGWADTGAVGLMVAGLIVLVAFFVWERIVASRPGGQPLVDLRLFRSAAYTWGVILAAAGMMTLVGILFTMPQYFQAILGTDAQGAGFRLLPVIGGMIVGAVLADRLAAHIGAKLTVALGFLIGAAAMLVGATTAIGSEDVFMAIWTFFAGAGAGIELATASAAAVVQLPADQAGVGAGLVQAISRLGAPFGSAILGSVLSATYQSQVQVAGLPESAAAAVKGSVFAGLAVAQQTGIPALAVSARASFIAGMDDSLRVASAIAVVGVLLALAFLPSRMREVEESGAISVPTAG